MKSLRKYSPRSNASIQNRGSLSITRRPQRLLVSAQRNPCIIQRSIQIPNFSYSQNSKISRDSPSAHPHITRIQAPTHTFRSPRIFFFSSCAKKSHTSSFFFSRSPSRIVAQYPNQSIAIPTVLPLSNPSRRINHGGDLNNKIRPHFTWNGPQIFKPSNITMVNILTPNRTLVAQLQPTARHFCLSSSGKILEHDTISTAEHGNEKPQHDNEKARELAKLGSRYKVEKEWVKAKDTIEKALELCSPDNFIYLALLHKELGVILHSQYMEENPSHLTPPPDFRSQQIFQASENPQIQPSSKSSPAVPPLQRAIQFARKAMDLELEILTTRLLAEILSAVEDNDKKAEELMKHSLQLNKNVKDVKTRMHNQFEIWFELGNLALKVQNNEEAAKRFRESLRYSALEFNSDGVIKNLEALTSVFQLLKDYPKATEYAQELIDFSHKFDQRGPQITGHFHLGSIHYAQNQIDEAVKQFYISSKVAAATGDHETQIYCLLSLGECKMKANKPEEAEQFYIQAADLAHDKQLENIEVMVLQNLGKALMQSEKMELFLEIQQRVLQLFIKARDALGVSQTIIVYLMGIHQIGLKKFLNFRGPKHYRDDSDARNELREKIVPVLDIIKLYKEVSEQLNAPLQPIAIETERELLTLFALV